MRVCTGRFISTLFSRRVNHLDIAPQHASVLMGISNTFATVPGIVSPTLTGYIVQNKVSRIKTVKCLPKIDFHAPFFLVLQSVEEWRIVFMISSGIYLVGCLIYWFWVSGELQPWAQQPKELPATEKTSIAPTKGTIASNGYVNEAIELKEWIPWHYNRMRLLKYLFENCIVIW